MATPTKRPLLLTGFMGTGKSTTGPIVAAEAGVPFIDLDAEIERRTGKSVATIFTEAGEPAFREREAQVLRSILAKREGVVVALGGGALLNEGLRRECLEKATVVTLVAPASVIADRTSKSSRVRPLLKGTTGEARLALIEQLLATRQATYAESHAQIRCDRPHEEVARSIRQAWDDLTLAMPLGARAYPVRITDELEEVVRERLGSLEPSSVVLVTDQAVAALHHKKLRGIEFLTTIKLQPGEGHKTLAAVENVVSEAVRAGADRKTVVVAHGGGVTCDIAGFAASILLRGVRWIACPTTLLSMVDASIGGKTGVDLGLAKNAVGTFHQPSGVFIDPAHVMTESQRAYRSGLAEVVKTACLGDQDLFDLLESQIAAVNRIDITLLREIVFRCASVKAGVVSRDERETGERALLNFGHTFGHAIESSGQFAKWTHGEAVSIGMAAMLRVGTALGLTAATLRDRVIHLLDQFGLPTSVSSQEISEALPLLSLDKKRTSSRIRVIFLRDLGSAAIELIEVHELSRYLEQNAAG